MMLARYAMRLRKWLRYAAGSSYQHVRQERGALFRPGALEGYFNDLRHKADWTGATVDDVPVVRTDTNPAFAFPIVIFQWGLGNWDLWLQSGRTDAGRLAAVTAAARWAVANLSDEGGWACWTGLVRPTVGPYSAMAQGEGVSLLVRTATVVDDARFSATARRAADFMLASGRHGLTRDHGGWTSLEEYPGDTFPAVLNGWVFALVGLVDLAIATGDSAMAETADRFAGDLARAAKRFDNGYWSTYDLAGNVASPFYHDLHIAQLRTLATIFPRHGEAFDEVATRFVAHRASRVRRLRAVAVKIVQKLSQTSVGEMA